LSQPDSRLVFEKALSVDGAFFLGSGLFLGGGLQE
jgi:hypothetical protein